MTVLEFNGYTEEATEGMSFLSKHNITYVSGVSKELLHDRLELSVCMDIFMMTLYDCYPY